MTLEKLKKEVAGMEAALAEMRERLHLAMIRDFLEKHPEYRAGRRATFMDGRKKVECRIYGHKVVSDRVVLKAHEYRGRRLTGLDRRVDPAQVKKKPGNGPL